MRTAVHPYTLLEDHYSRDNASWRQAPLSRSLQKAEAVLRTRLNPSLRRNFQMASSSSSSPSRPSGRLQSVERNVAELGAECHLLWDAAAGRLQTRGCVRAPVSSTTSSSGNALHHYPAAAAFGQHYGQLWGLLEERAKLTFLQEYSRRWQATHGFVTKLSRLLQQQQQQLLVNATRRQQQQPQQQHGMIKRPRSTMSVSESNLGLQALAQELRVHLSHWDVLRSQAYSNVYLRRNLFWWRESLQVMLQSCQRMGLQCVFLMEQCIYTSLCVMATQHLRHLPRDALRDLLACVQIFNHTVLQTSTTIAQWRKRVDRLTDWPYLSTRLPATVAGTGTGTFTVFQILKMLAEQRGQMLAEQLHLWSCQQMGHVTRFGQLATAGQEDTAAASLDWSRPEEILVLLSGHTWQQSDNNIGPPPLALTCRNGTTRCVKSGACYADRPFWLFLQRDCECLEVLFQALASTTDDVPSNDILDNSKPGASLDLSATPLGGTQGRGQRKPHQSSKAICEKPKAIQWGGELCSELFPQYQEMFRAEFSRAAIRCLFHKGHRRACGSLNQWRHHLMFQLLGQLSHASHDREPVPVEGGSVLRGLCVEVLYSSACTQWDEVMCDALGHGLKDRCVPTAPGAGQESSLVITATTQGLLGLFSPLSILLQLLKATLCSGNGSSVTSTHIFGLLWRSVATVQACTVWVMSRAYQFLSSWNINKFLLITQGDLVALHSALRRLSREVEDLSGELDLPFTQALAAEVTRGVAQLKVFSDLILRIFSMDCKRMTIEIFEQTMPSAKHWRVNYKTELPSSPSEYAACAVQSVIGQVLEGVQLLPEEARVQTLTEAMTVFMEAWMEHILRQKIKFSIQGALQLKEDFGVIRDLLRSEEYRVSEELHQKLLSLRVFQQVDSAILCLLQQPVSRSYMPSHAWEPFRHCCPGMAQVDQASGSLNNLDSMDIQAAHRGSLTPPEGPLTPPEMVSAALPDSYFPQAQQEWLDLRVHSNTRWRLPGLYCLTKSEP
ncbi:uncharacterized protein ccdc142 [Engraulis encrasicolus]|uniref:uncharacterized protein ccdc142 n=1 Tax=Engraulis encrasicolus TaxID=184585 RepID=UPI002FD6D47D